MKYFITFLAITLLFACQNDDIPGCEPNCEPPDVDYYKDWLEPIENPIQKDLQNPGSIIGPFIYFLDQYEYKYSCFNPNNPYEIAYIRSETGASVFGELFVFNFKDGTTKKIADSIPDYSQFDWSVRDWIVFRGARGNLWRIKSRGDSLSQFIPNPGSQANPRWSPDGKKLLCVWTIYDLNGDTISRLNEKVYVSGWLDNQTVLGNHVDESKGIVSYHTQNHTCTSLIPDVRLESNTFLKMEALQLFETRVLDNGDRALLRYDMDAGRIDSIKKVWFSHRYGNGNYHPKTERALVNLIRYDWKDSIFNQIYFRQHLVMLDKDGNELGVVKIPE